MIVSNIFVQVFYIRYYKWFIKIECCSFKGLSIDNILSSLEKMQDEKSCRKCLNICLYLSPKANIFKDCKNIIIERKWLHVSTMQWSFSVIIYKLIFLKRSLKFKADKAILTNSPNSKISNSGYLEYTVAFNVLLCRIYY